VVERIPSGRIGEEIASLFLKLKGYRILGRNLRSRSGEIDILAEAFGCLVFAEVKLRGPGSISSPLEAVDRKKRERVVKGARYLLSNCVRTSYDSVRFDVFSVSWERERLVVEHVEDAFRIEGAGAW
jgi:putative endonuclease